VSTTALGVALVGAGADHWGATAHIPALHAVEGVRLHTIVSSSPEAAERAQQRHGVPATHELRRVLDDASVDVVTVTLRVPQHAAVVEAAIAAGKHVYCEWPLARSTDEARSLTALSAARPDRVHVTGLQGRFSPALRTAAELIADGRIGRPLTGSVGVYMSLGIVPRPAHRAHLRHASVGANVLTIHGGHVLDMVEHVLGRATVNTARMWSAVPEFVVDTGEVLPRDAPDNVVALLDFGEAERIPVSVQLSHTAAAEGFTFDVHGTQGSIALRATGQPQFGNLTLTLTPLGGRSETIAPRPGLPYVSPLPAGHPGENVASLYAALADAVATGGSDGLLPRFPQAVALHELVDAIAGAAADRPLTRL
jgi:Predicted dehydrogenases and related proteins